MKQINFPYWEIYLLLFLINAQSRIASDVLDGVLAPLRLLWHTLCCPFLCSSGSNIQDDLRALEGCNAVPAKKTLQGSETETRELLQGTEEISVSPMRD